MGMYGREKQWKKEKGRLAVIPAEAVKYKNKLDEKGNKIRTGAQQQFKKECDINFIVARAKKTGFVLGNPYGGQGGDFTAVVDLKESMDKVHQAQEMFAQLPAKARKAFDNDPAKFLDFAKDWSGNEKKAQMMVDIGLANPRVLGRFKTQNNDGADPAPEAAKGKKSTPSPKAEGGSGA